ncbi:MULTISPECIES: DsbA family protein [unclassified Streptomyces]|uniref:DsbA family protein n=1 Tax=unclassified Streptomyces TaxID=2593676 RepID=UPI000F44BFC9|nr:DsbA family protein [Streptomyces sp. I6]RNL73899.1 hypothetical protein EBF04_29610 [Streptomyces sp. I6]
MTAPPPLLHLGDRTALADVAAAAGLDRDAALAFLASQEGTDEVRAEPAQAVDVGVTAVPTFIFDRKVVLQGAQSPKLILELSPRSPRERSRPPPSGSTLTRPNATFRGTAPQL